MPLTLQRQGDSECQLAVFAMLHDVPLSEVRVLALHMVSEIAGVEVTHWVDVCGDNALAWKVLDELTELFLGAKIDRRHIRNMPCGTNIIPNGKGEFVLAGPGCCHAVAYCDGLVYNSNGDSPMNEEAFNRYLIEYKFEIIQVIPLKE